MMLSHCVPDPLGDAKRGRAWQLLQIARRHHRVRLLCVYDGPVSLRQWSAIAIDEAPLIHRPGILERVAGWWHGSRHIRPPRPTIGTEGLIHAMPRPAEGYDRVLCTDITLWPVAMRIAADHYLCDLGLTPPEADAAQPRAVDELYRRVLEEADVVTSPGIVDGGHRPVLLPLGVDAAWYQPGPASDMRPAAYGAGDGHSGPLAMALGGGGHNRTRKLIRDVWHTVKRVFPAAKLTWHDCLSAPARRPRRCTHPATDLTLVLRQASIIIAAGNERFERVPAAQWPIMQAMASARLVIGSAEIGRGLGATDGEHLLVGADPEHWSHLCITALGSPLLRHRLGHSARRHVTERFGLNNPAHDPLSPIRDRATPHIEPVPLAPAA